MNPFEEIARELESEKCGHGAYMDAYWRHLGNLRDKPIRLLEMGLNRGVSLQMWQRWFPKAEIYGIDIHEESWKEFVPEGVHVWVGDQGDEEFLAQFLDGTGGRFDVIIDDAGHEMTPQQTALQVLWETLNSGGHYIIEDLETSYQHLPQEPGPPPKITTDFLAEVQTSLHQKYHERPTMLKRLKEMHGYSNCIFLVKE